MFSQNYTVSIRNLEVRVTNKQLSEFAAWFDLSEEIESRISELLWLDLYIYDQECGINPNDVVCEIKNLECGEHNSGTKPASLFKYEPLKGLYHKHFFSAHFILYNIFNDSKSGVLEKRINKMLDPNKSPTKEMIGKVVHGSIEDRATNNKLTGECIVFAKYDEKNYYLCLKTHNTEDQMTFDRINSNCQRDFPFLSALLTSASA